MLYSTIIAAASAFAGFAAAQNVTTPIPCCSVAAGTVPSDQRDAWCQANQNTCVELCGGQGDIASNGNSCDSTSLDFSCKCSNGTDVSSVMPQYQQSVPGQMCRFWYNACIQAAPNDAAGQFTCETARDQQCGNKTTSDATDAGNQDSSSASASSGASSTSSSPSSTGSAGAATSSTAPAAAANLAVYGAPALIGGLLAVFGLAL
ncbi:hypothetical protein EJ02DRAFT_453346 [Clathrospora elynae]|uniref:DUF7707 domain-containing protein n=1 Tax=Clathrospora elynae TaxID=706981 RepID=A0A6A5STG1_9PLEO|nr:hypothetical protein EJ02DRAFT_453346 [Clathrospora elynae]